MNTETIELEPTVMFQIADHRRRYIEGNSNKQRVIGCLMGYSDSKIQISNSFPIPFEESRHLTYLDLEYAKNLIMMFRKVYPEEVFLGFYSTRPIQASDAALIDLFHNITPNPILLTIDCTEGNVLQPFFKVYQKQELLQSSLHWSEVEKVVLSNVERKRDFQQILEALQILQSEISVILENKDKFNEKIFGKIEEILNSATAVDKDVMIKRANDYSVGRVVGELTKLCVMLKKNK